MVMKLKDFNEDRMLACGKRPGWELFELEGVIAQKKLGVVVRQVMWEDEKGNIAYDQILRAEKGGGMFVPVDESGRVGLMKYWRPQTTDQKAWSENFPNFDVESLGRESWELPRGFAKVEKEQEGDTADIEAEEETQSKVVSSESFVFVCDNTAVSPHLTQIKLGVIDTSISSGRKPDPNEGILSKLTFFSLAELKNLQDEGLLYCAYTLSVIGVLAIQKPDLLK